MGCGNGNRQALKGPLKWKKNTHALQYRNSKESMFFKQECLASVILIALSNSGKLLHVMFLRILQLVGWTTLNHIQMVTNIIIGSTYPIARTT